MDTCEFLLITEDGEFGHCGKDAPWGTWCSEHANLTCTAQGCSTQSNHICIDDEPHCAGHCLHLGLLYNHPSEQPTPSSASPVLS